MTTSLPNEAHLVHCLQTNQAVDFAKLYDAFSPALYGVLVRIVHDPELAADLLQDAFIKIWTNRMDYDPGQGRLFTWLVNITRNKAIDELRLRKLRARANSYLYDHLEHAERATHQEGRLTTTLTGQLDPKYKIIVDMHYQQALPLPEVATRLKLPIGTVKTRYRKAMELLKTFFSQDIHLYQQG